MELNKPEVDAISAVMTEVTDQLKLLTDLELMLAGGGQGEVSLG